MQNAQSILLARQRAEEELVRAKEALELKTQELAHSLAMMRATLESTTDGILVTDGGGKVTGFNEKFVEMWRMPREVMDSREHRQLLEVASQYFKDPRQFLARIEDIYASSPPESYDLLELADGRVFERFSRIQFVDERNVGRVWSFRDITASKQAERTTRFLADASAALAELTDYESTLQKVASLPSRSLPTGAPWTCWKPTARSAGWRSRTPIPPRCNWPTNSSAAIPLGLRPPRRHEGAAHRRAGVGRDDLRTRCWWSSAQDEEHLRILRQLGLKSYICVPLRSRTRTLGVLTFVTAESGRVYDATDLAAAEDLAHRAVIAIENASLLAALKEADRRKDEFLAMLAHELRNPLAPIRNAVQIFRAKGPPVPELQWATEVIDRQVQQMTRLVDDLLDVSRITRGKIELRKERVELATVVNSAVEASRPLIEKWGHELTVTIPPQPIHLEADPTRLAQVLLNLLNNAAKYTDQGGRIWLTAERQGDQVLIRVKDTGIGIPAEMLPRIFEMFTQVDRSLERSQGGLGIGLTLVQRLVEMHGGTRRGPQRRPRQGQRVRRAPAGRRGGQAATARRGGMAARRSLRPPTCRILVVDDNQDAADSLGMLLRMMGNEVHTAHDGLEAVGAAAAFQPDVVLLDIGLPKLNGYEAARRIREQEAVPTWCWSP